MDKNFSAIEAWRATKEVSSMVKKLGVLNNLLFDDKTLFKDAREKLANIYPELMMPSDTDIIVYRDMLKHILEEQDGRKVS